MRAFVRLLPYGLLLSGTQIDDVWRAETYIASNAPSLRQERFVITLRYANPEANSRYTSLLKRNLRRMETKLSCEPSCC